MDADPFHLTRRDVVKGGLAGAATFAAVGTFVGPAAASPGNWPSDYDRVALLADTHLGDGPDVIARGQNVSANLVKALQRLATLAPAGGYPTTSDRGLAWMIVNGDIALDTGRNHAYAEFDRVIQPHAGVAVGPPCVTLGNHDHRGNAIDAGLLPLCGHDEPRCYRKINTFSADWYLLDSLRLTDEVPGELGEAQLTWLEEQLATPPVARDGSPDPQRPAFIVVHHDPDDPRSDGYGLVDGRRLLDLLIAVPRVKALFHGHRHVFDVRYRDDLPIIGQPATAYAFGKAPLGFLDALPVRRSAAPVATTTPADAGGGDYLRLTFHTLDPGQPQDGETQRIAFR